MANTLDADLIVDILAERAMNVLPSALSPLSAFSTDFSDTPTDAPRQTIQVELVKTAGSVLTNPTNFEVTATENANVAVASNHLSRPVGLTIQDLNLGHRLMTKADKALEAIANAVLDTCMTLVTTTNYDNTPIEVGEAFNKATLKKMWAAISNGRQKNAVLSGQNYANFLPENLDSFDPTRSRTGLFGFDHFDYHNRFAAAGDDIVAFACDPSAMAVAARLPMDFAGAQQSDYIVSDSVTINPLGISVQFNVWFARGSRAAWLSYDVVFGAAVGDKTALTVVTDAEDSGSV